MKLKKCSVCNDLFKPVRPLQKVCSPSCALEVSKKVVAKNRQKEIAQDKRETKAKLDSLKTKADLAKEAQTVINKYVRLRDKDLGCVSCDKPANWDGQWHASHFRSVGAASSIRFNLWNIHKSCSICNNWKSGNLSEYEPRLRQKIGDEKVDWLRAQNQLAKYSPEYLKRLKDVFKAKIKRLERN